jgi:TamB, inner membrane protein subunit of TAM complex
VLLLFFNLVLNFPFVQTALTHTIAGYYSKRLHVKVHIGKVDFEFLKKLVLRDVLVQDLHADTLLYATDLKFDIGQLSFKTHDLYLSNIDIDKAKVHLTTYKNEHSLNMQFIIDYFSSRDTTKGTGARWNITFGKLSLNNVGFRLQNKNDTGSDKYGVNFSNLDIPEVRGTISAIRFMDDTIRATIEKLTARDKSGFSLNRLSCYVNLCPRGMELDALKIETPNTSLSTDLIFKYNGFADFGDFTNKVEMRAKFHKSKICFDDIGYFAHGLKAVHNCFTISGEYYGTVNHLTAHNMSISWGKFSTLEGEAQLNDITDIDSAYMKVYISKFTTSKTEIENLPIPPFDKENHITLPDNLAKLNTIHLTGFFDGSIHSFKTGGTIKTSIGDISANLHLWETPGSKVAQYTGLLETKNFDLGNFWQVKDFGTITTSVSITGNGLKKENADATLSGIIQSMTYRKYTYQNTSLSGELKKGFFSGLVKITDPHLLLDFNGKINLASQNSVFQFETHITKANLTALHIINDTSALAILSAHITVDATGNTIDNLQGSVYIDSTSYAVHKDVYHLNHLKLTSSINEGYDSIKLQSDYMDGELTGHFHLTSTLACIQNLMATYLPSVFPKEAPARGDKEEHDYSLSLHFNENTGLTNLFMPGLKLAQGTIIKAIYNESSNNINLSGSSDEIDISSKKIKSWKISANGDENSLVFKSGCDTLYVSDSLYAANFKLNGNIGSDTIHYKIAWNDDSANFATIPGYIGFTDKSRIYFKFQHPVISMVDSVWKINNDNLIEYDSSRWVVKSFIISHANQSSISLQGAVADNDTDKLNICIHNFNLANFALGSSQFEGELNGTASISDLLNRPFFTSALNFSGLYFNKEYIGDGNINSRWDTLSQSIVLDAHFLYHGAPVLALTGKYIPGSVDNNLSMDASFTSFPANLFQRYIKDVSSILDGSITGQAHITGTPAKPMIYGNVTAQLKRMKFDYLNTSYHSPGINIKITPDTFKVISSLLLDEKNDTARYSGIFTHHNFKDLKMDFYLNVKNFLCLNTSETQNSSYFGKGFVTGYMRIYGLLDALHIEATVTTNRNTAFNIPLESVSDLDQANYIQFKSKGKNNKNMPIYKVDLSGIQVDFNVTVTSDATSRILFSNRGEVLESRGYGTIQFSMDNIGDINMRGTYTVTGGNYNFVLQNIINKKFILQPGGTLIWNGDPYNADINLTTQYQTRASLEPFFPNDISGVYNKRFNVYCDLDLSGKLTSPDIAFKIELPDVDNNTKQVVESYLSNTDELTTQVFGLLIINSFIPVGAGLGGNGFGNQLGVANSAEILSNQLTNMFNTINKNFNVGLDIQPGSTINPAEYKLALSTALFNGKVNVNTDVGTQSGVPTATQSTGSNTNFVGELNVEVKLDKSGKLSAKAFNKANDNTTLNVLNAPYTQGAGLTYKEGFNTWKEFWQKVFGKKSKTETDPDADPE